MTPYLPRTRVSLALLNGIQNMIQSRHSLDRGAGMDLDASFGHWLTQRRKALRLSRAELARRVCCAAITLRKIEEDARRPSRQIAAKLAEHLAIPAAECTTFIQVARGELRVERLPPTDEPGAGAPRTAASARPSNLPIPSTPLIGRAADAAAVREQALRGDV